jgi:hypothetical protein
MQNSFRIHIINTSSTPVFDCDPLHEVRYGIFHLLVLKKFWGTCQILYFWIRDARPVIGTLDNLDKSLGN